jgi:hypothetical protein
MKQFICGIMLVAFCIGCSQRDEAVGHSVKIIEINKCVQLLDLQLAEVEKTEEQANDINSTGLASVAVKVLDWKSSGAVGKAKNEWLTAIAEAKSKIAIAKIEGHTAIDLLEAKADTAKIDAQFLVFNHALEKVQGSMDKINRTMAGYNEAIGKKQAGE